MTEADVIGRINDFRKENGTTKAEMSRELCMDAGTLGNILNGRRGIPSELLVRFLEVYPMVSAEWLMRGEGNMLRTQPSSMTETENAAINRLITLLEEKDKQVDRLTQLLAKK